MEQSYKSFFIEAEEPLKEGSFLLYDFQNIDPLTGYPVFGKAIDISKYYNIEDIFTTQPELHDIQKEVFEKYVKPQYSTFESVVLEPAIKSFVRQMTPEQILRVLGLQEAISNEELAIEQATKKLLDIHRFKSGSRIAKDNDENPVKDESGKPVQIVSLQDPTNWEVKEAPKYLLNRIVLISFSSPRLKGEADIEAKEPIEGEEKKTTRVLKKIAINTPIFGISNFNSPEKQYELSKRKEPSEAKDKAAGLSKGDKKFDTSKIGNQISLDRYKRNI